MTRSYATECECLHSSRKKSGLVRRRGAIAFEFALLAPAMVLLAFGMIEFGRAIMVQGVVNDATRQGARVASLEGSTEEDVRDTIEASLTAADISTNSMTVTIEPADLEELESGDRVMVGVALDYGDVSLLRPRWLANSEIRAATTWRSE